jgi:transcriptional regulator with XRE-family HTH domain
MREDRGWSQSYLAAESGMAQPRICVLEDPSYDKMNISTLKRIAAAFDVALIVRFVPYSELLISGLKDSERGFSVSSFKDDSFPESASSSWTSKMTVFVNGGGPVQTQIPLTGGIDVANGTSGTSLTLPLSGVSQKVMSYG